MKKTTMSGRELKRVEVLGRVASKELKLKDAAAMSQMSYRQETPIFLVSALRTPALYAADDI